MPVIPRGQVSRSKKEVSLWLTLYTAAQEELDFEIAQGLARRLVENMEAQKKKLLKADEPFAARWVQRKIDAVVEEFSL